MRDKVTRQCPQTTTFLRERRAEADSNRGPSAYQPNALPLGQTGSRNAPSHGPVYIGPCPKRCPNGTAVVSSPSLNANKRLHGHSWAGNMVRNERGVETGSRRPQSFSSRTQKRGASRVERATGLMTTAGCIKDITQLSKP